MQTPYGSEMRGRVMAMYSLTATPIADYVAGRGFGARWVILVAGSPPGYRAWPRRDDPLKGRVAVRPFRGWAWRRFLCGRTAPLSGSTRS